MKLAAGVAMNAAAFAISCGVPILPVGQGQRPGVESRIAVLQFQT
jgi:hypothetical protein